MHGQPFPSIDWIKYVDGKDKPIAKYDSEKKEMTLGMYFVVLLWWLNVCHNAFQVVKN